VIAEVKRRSPSKGWLAPDLDVAQLARHYQNGGAAAISVLTDEEFFAGSREDLMAVRRSVDLPLLRKDFTVGPNDVIDAAEMGAAAVLLIAAALSDVELRLLLDVASRVGLDALVEVHDELETRRALDAGATTVGVNQRDLRTFEVDTRRAARVAATLPGDVVRVAESGLATREDVQRAGVAGFDAVLVGEALVTSNDAMMAVRELCGVPKDVRE
jgi:indole-3-glycerol phosphate synthase